MAKPNMDPLSRAVLLKLLHRLRSPAARDRDWAAFLVVGYLDSLGLDFEDIIRQTRPPRDAAEREAVHRAQQQQADEAKARPPKISPKVARSLHRLAEWPFALTPQQLVALQVVLELLDQRPRDRGLPLPPTGPVGI